MEELDWYELDLIIRFLNFSHKLSWEMARWNVWAALAPYMTKLVKGLKLEQMFPLATDNDYVNVLKEEKVFSKERIEKMKELLKMLNEKL